MPRVRFLPDDIEVEIEAGGTLLAAAARQHLPLHSECGGSCNCGTCRVIIVEDAGRLSPMRPEEEHTLGRAAGPDPRGRLACQCRVHGDVEVWIPESSRADGSI